MSFHVLLIDNSKGVEEMTEETMTIRQMCDAFGVTPRTLRFYEAKELLFPIREGQKRWFTRSDRGRLKLILRGKRFGFSLEEIRQLLDMYEPEGQNLDQLTKTFEIAQDRLVDMIRQRAELTEAIDELQAQLRWGEEMLQSLGQTTPAQPLTAAS